MSMLDSSRQESSLRYGPSTMKPTDSRHCSPSRAISTATTTDSLPTLRAKNQVAMPKNITDSPSTNAMIISNIPTKLNNYY